MTIAEYELLQEECRTRTVRGKYKFDASRVGKWVTITVTISDARLLINSNARRVKDIYGGYHLSNAYSALDRFENEMANPELQVSPSRYDSNGLVFTGMFTRTF